MSHSNNTFIYLKIQSYGQLNSYVTHEFICASMSYVSIRTIEFICYTWIHMCVNVWSQHTDNWIHMLHMNSYVRRCLMSAYGQLNSYVTHEFICASMSDLSIRTIEFICYTWIHMCVYSQLNSYVFIRHRHISATNLRLNS